MELKMWHLSPSEADVGEGGHTGGQVGDSPELESTGHLGQRPPNPLASLGTGRAVKVQLSSCTGSQQVQCLLWVGKGVTGLLPHFWDSLDTTRWRHTGRELPTWKETSGVARRVPCCQQILSAEPRAWRLVRGAYGAHEDRVGGIEVRQQGLSALCRFLQRLGLIATVR